MKPLILVLVVLFLVLQYKLWLGPGGFTRTIYLQQQIAKLHAKNDQLEQRNAVLLADIKALKTNKGAIEARARSELGMIRKGETFYQVVR